MKQHFALSRGDYHWGHEPAWYAVRGKGQWRGDRRQTTVWEVANLNPMGGTRAADNAVTGHGTQKPVRLFEIPILNHTVAGDALYDPFCGSGTASSPLRSSGVACYAMDIDPQYVQAAVTRWEAFTGQKAVRHRSARARRRGGRDERPVLVGDVVAAAKAAMNRARGFVRANCARWNWSMLGWSQHQIAADLGISQAAVSKILKRVELRLLRELAETVERQKARQTLRLEHLFAEAMRAWEQSKADTTRRRQRKTQVGHRRGGGHRRGDRRRKSARRSSLSRRSAEGARRSSQDCGGSTRHRRVDVRALAESLRRHDRR